ncbi:MAG: hypothetical protein QXR45_15245 [Candidatus Bathyarchaeia archaeon]
MAKIVLIYAPDLSNPDERRKVMDIIEKMKTKSRIEIFSENCFIMNSIQLSLQLIKKVKEVLSNGRILYLNVEDSELRRWPE